jgi:Leucine-rich repeat (LRR) protein
VRADSNAITALDSSNAMAKLRVLRVSNNKLQRLSGAAFPNLRTLYADNNAIVGLDKASRLSKLENLSLRNQSGKGLYVPSACPYDDMPVLFSAQETSYPRHP